jgi:hypothetical protein
MTRSIADPTYRELAKTKRADLPSARPEGRAYCGRAIEAARDAPCRIAKHDAFYFLLGSSAGST